MNEIPCAGRNKIISDSVEFYIALLGTLRQSTGEMQIKYTHSDPDTYFFLHFSEKE